MESKSQQYKVLKHLKSGKTLTQAQAVELFKVWRLSAVIERLRKKGYNISTTLIGKSRYGVYKLEDK